MQRLCLALGAKREEALALTYGPFAPAPPRTGGEIQTAKGLAERMAHFSQTLYDPPFVLKDLELLSLRADAWALAARNAADPFLLAEAHLLACCFLNYRDRFHEAAEAAERYLDLTPRPALERSGAKIWVRARLTAAESRWNASEGAASSRYLEELRQTLPLARGTINESDALIKISKALHPQGFEEEALRAVAEAHGAAQRTMDGEKAEWVRGAVGIQLIRSKRCAEGLPLLSTGGQGDWYRLVETSLWRVEAFIGMGEQTEAQYWLTQAQADLTRYEITPLQPRLDSLRAQLHGEPAFAV